MSALLAAPELGLRDRLMFGALHAVHNAEATIGRSREILEEKRDLARQNGAAPVLVAFIVLIAVLLVLAAAISIAVLIFCANKGMNFEWYVKTSWFEMKVVCSK